MSKRRTARSMPAIGERLSALVAAGVLSASFIAAPMAFAADVTPSTGSQVGSGATDVTIQLKGGATETGGAGSEGNPDSDHDGFGDNIAFSVPTSINFVVNGQGGLTGPMDAEIQNHSKFPIHGSSLEVSAEAGWNIVADASAATQSNAIDFQIGPVNDMLDAADYVTKAAVNTPSEWNMAANSGTIALRTSGDVNNVAIDISQQTKVATMHWYVTPGSAA